MSWDWHWISWFKGTPFQWGEFRFNSGNPYKSYRCGPLLIRVFMVEQYSESCDNPDCEYQNNCCYFCDVCGMWYSKDEPCEQH